MVALLLESAARSLLLAVAASIGLRFLQVRNPHDEMTAWRLVLVAALAMPLLVHVLAPWVTLAIPASAPLAQIAIFEPTEIDQRAPTAPSQAPRLSGEPSAEDISTHTSSELGAKEPAAGPPRSIRWQSWITVIYLLVGGTLLLRMLIGIVAGFRLLRICAAAGGAVDGG